MHCPCSNEAGGKERAPQEVGGWQKKGGGEQSSGGEQITVQRTHEEARVGILEGLRRGGEGTSGNRAQVQGTTEHTERRWEGTPTMGISL